MKDDASFPTVMREAFDVAARRAPAGPLQAAVKSALRRRVGLVHRRQMWSVTRERR